MSIDNRPRYYYLDEENQPRPYTGTEDEQLFAWARDFEKPSRIIDWTEINSEYHVSTVFLGLDHNHWGRGPAILFETMVFKGNHGEDMQRYSTYDDAKIGHKAAVRRTRERIYGKAVPKVQEDIPDEPKG